MKKVYLSLVMLAASFAGFSQFQKNDVLLNGSVNFNSNVTKPISATPNVNTKGTGAGFSLNASKFVSDKAFNTFGVYFGYTSAKQNTPANISRTNGISTGISLGHTKLASLASRVYLTFPFTLNAGINNSTTKNNDVKTSATNGLDLSLNASIGLMYQTKKNLVFTCTLPALASISYNNTNAKTYTGGNVSNTAKTSSFGVGGGLGNSPLSNISVGVGFLIR